MKEIHSRLATKKYEVMMCTASRSAAGSGNKDSMRNLLAVIQRRYAETPWSDDEVSNSLDCLKGVI